MPSQHKLSETVAKLCEVVSAQQKELFYLTAIVEAFYACSIERDPELEACFRAKDALSRKNPGEAMQALAESVRQLDEAARKLKDEFGPWSN